MTKGNQAVAGELNKAMEIITATNPFLTAELNRKYFTGEDGLVLSELGKGVHQPEGDRQGRRNAGTGTASVPGKKRGDQGISIEVLKYIEEQTGLSYEIVPFHNWEEYSRAMEDGAVDLVVGIAGDYEVTGAESCALTLSYLSVPLR